MDFNIEHEAWNVYRLADGTTLRVRIVLTSVRRDDSQRTPDGAPVYSFDQQVLAACETPDHLKAGPTCDKPSSLQ